MVNPSFRTCVAWIALFVLTPSGSALAQEAEVSPPAEPEPAAASPEETGGEPAATETGEAEGEAAETGETGGEGEAGGEGELDPEAAAFLAGSEAAAAEGEGEGGAEAGEGEAGEGEETGEEEEEEDRGFGHRFQGGLGILAGTGYQFAIAWGGEYCHQPGEEDGQEVCHHRSPVFFDIQASFGVTEGLEVLAEYRIGLLEEIYLADSRVEEDPGEQASRPMAVGVGVRYYVSPLNRFKFFVGALFDIDFTKNLPVDVTLRPIFGLQIEFIRWMGFFVQASVNLSFIRNFGLSIDVAGGLQFRFP